MAFYAKLIPNGKLDLNERDAKEWLEKIDAAIEEQYKILDRGGLRIVLNLQNVRLLAFKHQKTTYCGELNGQDGDASETSKLTNGVYEGQGRVHDGL